MADDWHTCHFCGENIKDGKDFKGERHWLSDCRPDLVEHEIGPLCTWSYLALAAKEHSNTIDIHSCYAYSESNFDPFEPGNLGSGLKWTNEHTHFYKDGPM